MLVNFSKKFPFGGKGNSDPIRTKIIQACLMIFSHNFFLKRCSTINTVVDNNSSQISPKIFYFVVGNLGQHWPYVLQS